jgi:hypothetical protein
LTTFVLRKYCERWPGTDREFTKTARSILSEKEKASVGGAGKRRRKKNFYPLGRLSESRFRFFAAGIFTKTGNY